MRSRRRAPEAMVVGDDRLGHQVPFRDKLHPMLLVLMLMLGAIAIADLGSPELTTAEGRLARVDLTLVASEAELRRLVEANDPLYRIALQGATLDEVWTDLGIGLAFGGALYVAVVVLGRRLQTKLA